MYILILLIGAIAYLTFAIYYHVMMSKIVKTMKDELKEEQEDKASDQIGIRCERCNSLIKNAAKNKYQMNIVYPDYITGRKIMGTHEFVDCPFCGRQTIIGRRIYEEKTDAEDNDTGEAAESE